MCNIFIISTLGSSTRRDLDTTDNGELSKSGDSSSGVITRSTGDVNADRVEELCTEEDGTNKDSTKWNGTKADAS